MKPYCTYESTEAIKTAIIVYFILWFPKRNITKLKFKENLFIIVNKTINIHSTQHSILPFGHVRHVSMTTRKFDCLYMVVYFLEDKAQTINTHIMNFTCKTLPYIFL